MINLLFQPLNWKMKGKIAGQQTGVMVNKESVIGVATTDIVVEKIGQLEMDVMALLVELTTMYAY